jgi:hypothetical protein
VDPATLQFHNEEHVLAVAVSWFRVYGPRHVGVGVV